MPSLHIAPAGDCSCRPLSRGRTEMPAKLGLVVPRVDFLRRKVYVRSQAQRGQIGADLKTSASTRTVPADDWVLSEVSAHIQRSVPASAR